MIQKIKLLVETPEEIYVVLPTAYQTLIDMLRT